MFVLFCFVLSYCNNLFHDFLQRQARNLSVKTQIQILNYIFSLILVLFLFHFYFCFNIRVRNCKGLKSFARSSLAIRIKVLVLIPNALSPFPTWKFTSLLKKLFGVISFLLFLITNHSFTYLHVFVTVLLQYIGKVDVIGIKFWNCFFALINLHEFIVTHLCVW